jgi:hypothetical protein
MPGTHVRVHATCVCRRMWGTFILALFGFSSASVRLRLHNSLFRVSCAVVVDAIWVTLQSHQLLVAVDVALISFASLLAFHILAVIASRTVEVLLRSEFALQRALASAATEARALLDDLFPPFAVDAVVSGTPLVPIVSHGAVVLFCDLANFTRMGECGLLDINAPSFMFKVALLPCLFPQALVCPP